MRFKMDTPLFSIRFSTGPRKPVLVRNTDGQYVVVGMQDEGEEPADSFGFAPPRAR